MLCQRAIRPTRGVVLPTSHAAYLAEKLLHNLLDHQEEFASQAAFISRGLQDISTSAREFVASERELSGDHQRHHEAESAGYERNLDLPLLQHQESHGVAYQNEWSRLTDFLRPFAQAVMFSTMPQLREQDAEELFHDLILNLTRPSQKTGQVPIQLIIVFEDLLPNAMQILKFRTIDFVRKQTSQKAQPAQLLSLEQLPEGLHPKLAARSEDTQLTFEQIFTQCRELLTDQQWQLVYTLYVSRQYTMKELTESKQLLRSMELSTKGSPTTRRRRIDALLKPALEKLANELLP